MFHLRWLPFPMYRFLFFTSKWRKFDYECRWFRIYVAVMRHSPIDSSFEWLRVMGHIGGKWAYPVIIQAGYQPNCGLAVHLFHRTIFDNREKAKNALAKRDGWNNG